MSFRVVLIENDAKLSLKLNNLIIDKGEGNIWIPLDDISMIVIDNLHISLSARLLSVLAEKNIGVVISNTEHAPIGFYCSYDNHSRISKNIGYQIGKDKEFYDDLWVRIVKVKICNQYKCLIHLGFEESLCEKVNALSEAIIKGDKTNREAHAAKIYFNTLMGTSFSRGNEEILLNSGLDYGYSIIRSYLARLCVGYGLNTQLGIHHCNEYNRFNLVDDLIEPIRPFVDYYVYGMLKNEEYFKAEHRHKVVNILNHKVAYNGKKMFFCNMMEEYVSQYSSYLSGLRERIIFPDFDGYIGEKDEV